MATKMLRRYESDAVVRGRDLNRLMDTVLGNSGGRFKLWGDDGDELDLITGQVVSSNNYPLDVRSDAGYHGRFRNSTDTADVLKILDAGVTITGTLGVSGAVNLDGNVTIGNAAADTLTVEATSTFKAPASFLVNVTLGDAAGDTITINGTSTVNASMTLTGSSVLTLPAGSAGAPSLALGEATTGFYRQAAGTIGATISGTQRLWFSGTVFQVMDLPVLLTNARALRWTEAGGVARDALVMTAADELTLGQSNNATVIAGSEIIFDDASAPSLPADGSDPATTQTLVNAIKDLLVDIGLAT